MNDKCTPGPFLIRKCDCGHDMCDDYFVSVTRSDGRVSHADAKLIAAAPKLLAALQGIMDIGKRNTENPKYDSYYKEANNAIKEATL